MNSAVMGGFIFPEMKSSQLMKSVDSRLIQLATSSDNYPKLISTQIRYVSNVVKI